LQATKTLANSKIKTFTGQAIFPLVIYVKIAETNFTHLNVRMSLVPTNQTI